MFKRKKQKMQVDTIVALAALAFMLAIAVIGTFADGRR